MDLLGLGQKGLCRSYARVARRCIPLDFLLRRREHNITSGRALDLT